MKRIILGTALVLGAMGSAAAADLAVKAPPPPPPVWTWTGFYLGVNVGGGWTNNSASGVVFDAPTGTLFPISGATANGVGGVVGGGQVGYNWQTGPFVLGVEGDFDGSGERGTGALTACFVGIAPPACGFSASESVRWFATARGRAGWAIDNVLMYVTGGAAWQNVSGSLTAITPAGNTVVVSNSSTRSGWTAGFGVEAAFWEHWVLGAEYLYINTGSFGTNNFVVTAGSPLAVAGVPVGDVVSTNFNTNNNIVRARASYKF